ncbi:MAG TPA: PepSY domain-containing protein [Gammaproteobacteria bacterium]|nr:PepSY domain-containing protein [Gammaproteobacteria bacterium]
MNRRRKHHGIRLRSVFLWHRYFGLTAAALVVVLATTGLTLNHSEDWRLKERTVAWAWLLDWYGIHAAAPQSFRAGTHWISQLGDQIYVDDQPAATLAAPLLGAVAADGVILAASAGSLVLLTDDGELIERLDTVETLGGSVTRLGNNTDRRAVAGTSRGNFTSDDGYLSWQRLDTAGISWAVPTAPPAPLSQRLARAQRGEGLDLERVLLDLHSGRIFGRHGGYVMDTAAILMLGLAISGVWHWARRKRK